MLPALKKGPLFYKLFLQTPPFHFLPTGLYFEKKNNIRTVLSLSCLRQTNKSIVGCLLAEIFTPGQPHDICHSAASVGAASDAYTEAA